MSARSPSAAKRSLLQNKPFTSLPFIHLLQCPEIAFSILAAGFAFAISLGEFGATVFLARPDNPTLPVAIYRFLSRPGELNTAQAYALAVVLMAVTALALLLVDRVRLRRGGWV